MNTSDPLGATLELTTVRIRDGSFAPQNALVATEVPLTILVNNVELATLACTPIHCKELTMGFLFTSGLIREPADVHSFWCDQKQWRAEVVVATTPDPKLLGKRLYTAGCGKGVMFSTVHELASRAPLVDAMRVRVEELFTLMKQLQTSSLLHKQTGGVHTALLWRPPEPLASAFDDVGRHNAVDKAIGNGFINNCDFTASALGVTGRISSDILYKAKRARIPVVVSLGAATHQAVLLAADMGVTLVGFARGRNATIYTHPERIVP